MIPVETGIVTLKYKQLISRTWVNETKDIRGSRLKPRSGTLFWDNHFSMVTRKLEKIHLTLTSFKNSMRMIAAGTTNKK
jgi:hypothetical protein